MSPPTATKKVNMIDPWLDNSLGPRTDYSESSGSKKLLALTPEEVAATIEKLDDDAVQNTYRAVMTDRAQRIHQAVDIYKTRMNNFNNCGMNLKIALK